MYTYAQGFIQEYLGGEEGGKLSLIGVSEMVWDGGQKFGSPMSFLVL